MSVVIAPPPFQYLPNNNNTGSPAAGFQLFCYQAGTTTKQNTWTDSTQATPNANPIILDANGFIAASSGSGLWTDPTLKYKFVLALPTDTDPPTSPLRTEDNVQGPVNLTILTASLVGSIIFPRSAAEIAAGVTPTASNWFYGYPQRYGAVGDGLTDDSTAYANAALVSGSYPITILYTSGGYKIVTPFVLPNNGSMIGLGKPTLFATVNGTHIVSATGVTGEITIQGIIFKGTSASTVPLNGFGGFAAANTGLVTVSNCSNVRITDNDFTTFYNGVCTQGCTRVWIQRNKVDTFLTTGISCPSTTNFEVEFNDISNCTQAGGVVAYGVQCTGNQSGGATAQENSVSFNRILGIPSWDAIGTHDIDGLRVIGNDCRNIRHGIDVGHLVNTNVVQNIIIANNYVEGTATDTWGGSAAEIGGIIVAGFDATHRVSGCTVTGNMVKNFFNVTGMVGGGNGAGCIAVAHTDDVNITGNIIANCATLSGGSVIPQSTGIYATGTCNRLTIGPNSIQGNTFNRGGVRTSGLTGDAVTIVGNSGVYTTASTAHVSILTSTITNLNVNSNPTNSTTPYSESSTTTTNTSNATLAGSGNTATVVSTGSTIPTAFGIVRCTVAAASTGNILTAGLAPGQECVIVNESGANSITMAVAGTSNVADGTLCIIATNTYKRFVWDASTSLWYHG